MTRGGRIVQLAISPGGVPKQAVASAEVGPLGLFGDGHTDLRWHGGPERAVCLYSVEQLERLRAEGHPVAPGALGENVTTSGLDLGALVPGDRLRLGSEVILEIASLVDPCPTIGHCFADGRFGRISPKTNAADARRYARVLQSGRLCAGDPVERLPG
jgi:MOSC domain-containing protein YiiM